MALGVGLGACGDGTKTIVIRESTTTTTTFVVPTTRAPALWDVRSEEFFLTTCESGASVDVCRCILRGFERIYTYAEYQAHLQPLSTAAEVRADSVLGPILSACTANPSAY